MAAIHPLVVRHPVWVTEKETLHEKLLQGHERIIGIQWVCLRYSLTNHWDTVGMSKIQSH